MNRILVVDDEPEIINILESFLRKKGFEVVTAPGGEEAIETVNTDSKINLIILDIKMPGKSGLDVLEELFQLKIKLPVVILTGAINGENYDSRLKELGLSKADIVLKPIDLNILLDKIKKNLDINTEGK